MRKPQFCVSGKRPIRELFGYQPCVLRVRTHRSAYMGTSSFNQTLLAVFIYICKMCSDIMFKYLFVPIFTEIHVTSYEFNSLALSCWKHFDDTKQWLRPRIWYIPWRFRYAGYLIRNITVTFLLSNRWWDSVKNLFDWRLLWKRALDLSVILYSVMSMLATRGKRLHLIRKQLETNRITTRWNHWNEMNGTVCICPRTVFLELFVSFKVLNGRYHPTVVPSSSELHFNGAKILTVSEYWRSNQLQQK